SSPTSNGRLASEWLWEHLSRPRRSLDSRGSLTAIGARRRNRFRWWRFNEKARGRRFSAFTRPEGTCCFIVTSQDVSVLISRCMDFSLKELMDSVSCTRPSKRWQRITSKRFGAFKLTDLTFLPVRASEVSLPTRWLGNSRSSDRP